MKKSLIAAALLFLLVCVCACGAAKTAPRDDAGQAADGGQSEASAPADGGKNSASDADAQSGSGSSSREETEETEPDTAMKINVQIADSVFTATPEDNAAAREFMKMMRKAPVTIEMRDYSGFEKVGSLGKSLPADDRQTTTVPGDIVLYNENQIVMFYGSNSWSYTKLGHIDDLTGWEEALGSGGVTAVFTAAE